MYGEHFLKIKKKQIFCYYRRPPVVDGVSEFYNLPDAESATAADDDDIAFSHATRWRGDVGWAAHF